MATRTPHTGDVGSIIRVLFLDENGVALDVSGATTLEIFLRDPALATTTHAATFTTDGTDGLIQFTTIAGTFGSDGCWTVQGHVATVSQDWKSNTEEFTVLGNVA